MLKCSNHTKHKQYFPFWRILKRERNKFGTPWVNSWTANEINPKYFVEPGAFRAMHFEWITRVFVPILHPFSVFCFRENPFSHKRIIFNSNCFRIVLIFRKFNLPFGSSTIVSWNTRANYFNSFRENSFACNLRWWIYLLCINKAATVALNSFSIIILIGFIAGVGHIAEGQTKMLDCFGELRSSAKLGADGLENS